MKHDAGYRLPVFVVSMFVLALGALSYTLSVTPFFLPPILPAILVVAIIADAMTVEISSVTVSMVFPILAATTILYGPGVGGVVAAVATAPYGLRAKEKRFLRTLFNSGQFCLAFLLGGWTYSLIGGRTIGSLPLASSEIPRVIVPLALFAATSLVANSTLVAVAVTLDARIPFVEVWKSSFEWTIPTQAALAVLSLALAQVIASDGMIGLALFVVPLLIARQFYERYLTLRRTYSDTVRSLVAVIETKDAYTRGHSERVATYAVEIGRRLGFSEQRLERLELAALLHDLGKVGISRAILAKTTRLSEQEFETIKTHAELGGTILQGVPFLADLVPFVSAHHEHVDGTGYGHNLTGDEIPLEGRVLSVADAFDAMTSSRPYRPALTRDETVQELRRCAGAQFDGVVVETFIEALSHGVFSRVQSEREAVGEAV